MRHSLDIVDTGSRSPRRQGGPRFGAHLSVAGGLENAVSAAVRAGCDCLQIFVRNQRQWRAPAQTPEQVRRFRETASATDVAPVVAHASYLLNLASPDKATTLRSLDALTDELQRCEALGLIGLVMHPGAFMDGTPESGIARIARGLDEVHRRCPGFSVKILLETTAGQGSAIGWHFEELAAILDRVSDSDRLGVCLDTCHLFAAGYDFRSAEGYATMLAQLERNIGAERVACIHVNDSKRECGSRVDRHEHVGKGRIGKAGFAHFVNDARFRDVPFILETPKGVDGRGTDLDKVNLRRLRSLVQASARPAGRRRTPSR